MKISIFKPSRDTEITRSFIKPIGVFIIHYDKKREEVKVASENVLKFLIT